MSQRFTGIGRDPRDEERHRQAGPEQRIRDRRVHRPGDGQDDRVVDDLHDRDRHGVGGEGEAHRRTDRHAGAQQRPQGQGVSEDEGQHDGQHDRREVMPPELRRDDEAEDLADPATGEAMDGGLECQPIERRGGGGVFQDRGTGRIG